MWRYSAVGAQLRRRHRPGVPPGAPCAEDRRAVRVLGRASRSTPRHAVVLGHPTDREVATDGTPSSSIRTRSPISTAGCSARTSKSTRCSSPSPRTPRRRRSCRQTLVMRGRKLGALDGRGLAVRPTTRRAGASPRRRRAIPSSSRSSSRKSSAAPTSGPGFSPRCCHDRVAVELGTHRRQLLALGELGDAPLELVHARRAAAGPCARCAWCSRTA